MPFQHLHQYQHRVGLNKHQVILALHCEYSILVVLMLLMFLVEQHKVRVEMFLVKANNKERMESSGKELEKREEIITVRLRTDLIIMK